MSGCTHRLDAMNDRRIRIAAVCLSKDGKPGYVVFDGGFKLKISTYIDEYGEVTKDPEEAWYVVAGRDSVGWINLDLAEYWMPSYEDH